MIDAIIDEIEKRIKGKRDKIEIILCTFFAGGHILLDDVPGVGKTTIAKVIAKVLGLQFSRIQFTADLLPTDILGVNYYDVKNGTFTFKAGPIFSEIVLADEINRASPKTQSALLEAMEERQVSIEGTRYVLSENFFVIATKNPIEEFGTFPLPYSQIDRFMCSLSIGYPSSEFEKEILQGKYEDVRSLRVDFTAVKEAIHNIFVHEDIYDLVLQIGAFTRQQKPGLSTRALLAIVSMAKAYAYLRKREYVIDDDVYKILPFVVDHRIEHGSQRILEALL